MSETDEEYARGRAAGAARAEEYPDLMTSTEAAPQGSGMVFATGWRVGFADVRRRKYLEARAEGGQ